MRRFTSAFGMLLAVLWLPIAMMAESKSVFSCVQNPNQQPAVVTQTEGVGTASKQLLSSTTKLKAEAATRTSAKQIRTGRKIKSVVTPQDVVGDYVMTYQTLTSTGNDGGNAVKIATVPNTTDSIAISNFWQAGVVVKAKLDGTTKRITIPNQVVGESENDGFLDLAVITSTAKPDRAAEITGTLNDNGTITLDSWWAIFVIKGTNKDKFYGAYYQTELLKSNAKMSYKRWNSTTSTMVTGSYAVYVEQPSTNVVAVHNFANYGRTVEIELKRDLSATIATQVARKDVTNGDWSTKSTTYKDDYSGLTAYENTIVCEKATDKRNITWGNWTLLCSKYYLGAMTEGKITTDFDITYPTLSVSEFEGEGTEADPYKIKSLDDLILLSDRVNGNEEYNYGTITKYARVYLGKYFRMENDIDMSKYRFEPIGADWTHQFAGTFDGNGHTITGLTVNTGAKGYAGLFGKADTVSVIKNIKFDRALVEAANYYAGVVCAWDLGDIYNCGVTNSIVSNTGQTGAAGIAAIARSVYNCSVTTSNIIGAFGYAGGVAGQINNEIKNCYATNVMIKAGGVAETYPSGGVVGSLFNGKAEDCYFSGTVDGRYTSNLSVGGVAGVCYQGSINRCFATGSVYGYDTKAAVGGIVGNLYGPVTNSYSNCVVISSASRYAGGLVGYLRSWKDNDGNTFESSIKECYAAGTLDAETYQYDTATERREVIGKIMEGAKPTIENIYFDKQMVNFKSAEYGATSAELTSGSGVKGFDANKWVFTEGYYPRIKGLDDSEAAKFSVSTILLHKDSSIDKVARDAQLSLLGNTTARYIVDGNIAGEGRYSSISGNTLKLKEEFGTDSLIILNSGVGNRIITLKICPVPYEGAGSEENPYLLKTKDDLIKLSKYTSIAQQLFPDTYFKITNDIDLEKDPEFLGLCTSITTAATDAHVQFAGHIDGGGYFIHNMYLKDAVVWKTEPTDTSLGLPLTGSNGKPGSLSYKGFIGRLAPEGSVKNLNIAADCSLTNFWATSGAIVGYNYGLIENCKNYADVLGYSCWIGGITGQNLKQGVIRNCYNAGKITSGYMNAGGIAGSNYGLIENSENAGDITVDVRSTYFKNTKLKSAGGIAGSLTGGRITNSVNSGTIFALVGRAGGITATLAEASSSAYIYHNDVINCINYGTVLTEDKIEVGSIGGQAGSTGDNADTYYDGQITVYKANGNGPLNGVTDVETSVLTSGTALKNFSTELWSFDAGKYPVLKQFANEDLVKATRGIIINVAAGETVAALKSDVSLCEGNWTLKDGSVFRLDGNKVVVPATVKTLAVDTLVYTAGNVVKPFVIITRPEIPLTGAGTAEDPYLINNINEWNAIAEYMAVCGEPLTGKFLKVTADLDFMLNDINPFSYDGVTTFNGTLDGNGKFLKATREVTAQKSAIAFQALGEDAVVKNFTVDGELTTNQGYAAAVVYDLYGKLENVTNKATVTTTASKSYTAGVVGVANSGAELKNVVNTGKVTSAGAYTAGLVAQSKEGVKYVDCHNEGTITYTGGGTTSKLVKAYLAGFIANCLPDTIINCYNTGEIVAEKPTTTSTLSGFIGMATATSTSEPYYIKGCYNTADVTSAANNAGLIVDVNSSGYSKFTMEDCYNTGDISSTATGTVTSTYTSGLVNLYTPGSVYRNCWNKGTILSQKPTYASGIANNNKGSFKADAFARFVGCYNLGDIIASGNQGGGIVAYLTGYCQIDSCYNVGNIEGGFGLGGIVAALASTKPSVTNCWNAGDITTTTNRAGGIIGYNSSTTAIIENCYNLGDVSTTGTDAKNCYGIGGIAGQGSGHFTNVYSAGKIKGLARVGGILGYGYKGTKATDGTVNGTTLENAYFIGTVDAPADTCAMIIGVKMEGNGKNWNEINYVKNTYYASENACEGVNDAGTAVPYADLTKLTLGEGWTKGDYCLPTLLDINDNAFAKVYSVAVVPAEGDTYESITKNFFVGTPEGVTITTDNANVSISGNQVAFTKPFAGKLVVTAKATSNLTEEPTEVTKQFTLNCNVTEVSGINGVNKDGKTVVKEVFYNISGVEVAEPAKGDKAIYIVVKTYDDGTTETVKEVR